MRLGTSSTDRRRIDSAGRLLVNRTAAYASSGEKLSVNGMTSIQGSSTSAANLYIFNTDTTSDGTVQPYLFLHDGGGIRGGLGLQYSTSNFIINGQNVIQFRTGSSGVNGTERLRIVAAGIDVTGTITMDAVPGTNTNAALPVLFQTSAGVIDGGSQLTYNPGGDVLVVNGLTLSAGQVRTSGSTALQLTTANANGTVDLYVRTTHVECNGDFLPQTDNDDDLGSSSKRWANVYSADLQLSNVGTGGNEVDGTEGKWTLQEAEDTVYMINRINGKRYKIKMEEV